MDKKIAALLGAVAGVATIGSAQAATPSATPSQAATYADLLAPIPNAVDALKADDAAKTQDQGGFKLAQYPYYGYGAYYGGYGYGYRRHHHHHHHHHHHNYRGWRPY